MIKKRSCPLLASFLLALHSDSASAFWLSPVGQPKKAQTSNNIGLFSTFSAKDLLYQDQQNAMENRALHEETLLKKARELKAPKLKPKQAKSGTGFGGGASKVDPKVQLAIEQAKVLKRDGVIRVDNVLSTVLADELREHILKQKSDTASMAEQNLIAADALYGVENQRTSRCDLLLSLLHEGDDDQNHILAHTLQELLGRKGTLRNVYEQLVTLDGEFYELAAVITDPGSKRQKIHPDLPFKKDAPLYVVFLALQDVNEAMGPTSFLIKTHTAIENAKFEDPSVEVRDKQISSADHRISTLKKGDAVIFDARVLHCGNANNNENGSTRVLFNFSFRNPEVTGDLGYKGSIRPRYARKMRLQDLSDALAEFEKDVNIDPFQKFGNGIDLPSQ